MIIVWYINISILCFCLPSCYIKACCFAVFFLKQIIKSQDWIYPAIRRGGHIYYATGISEQESLRAGSEGRDTQCPRSAPEIPVTQILANLRSAPAHRRLPSPEHVRFLDSRHNISSAWQPGAGDCRFNHLKAIYPIWPQLHTQH